MKLEFSLKKHQNVGMFINFVMFQTKNALKIQSDCFMKTSFIEDWKGREGGLRHQWERGEGGRLCLKTCRHKVR